MIEGMKIRVTAEEIKARFQENVEFHKSKLAVLEREQVRQKEAMAEGVYQQPSMVTSSGTIESRIEVHNEHVRYFQFIHDHLMDDEYELGPADFSAMGIAPRYNPYL